MTVEGVSKTGKALNAYQKFVQQKFEERRQMSPSKRPSVPEHMKAVGAEWKNRNGKNKMKFFVLFAENIFFQEWHQEEEVVLDRP